jgi:hypothetical protein
MAMKVKDYFEEFEEKVQFKSKKNKFYAHENRVVFNSHVHLIFLQFSFVQTFLRLSEDQL